MELPLEFETVFRRYLPSRYRVRVTECEAYYFRNRYRVPCENRITLWWRHS